MSHPCVQGAALTPLCPPHVDPVPASGHPHGDGFWRGDGFPFHPSVFAHLADIPSGVALAPIISPTSDFGLQFGCSRCIFLSLGL